MRLIPALVGGFLLIMCSAPILAQTPPPAWALAESYTVSGFTLVSGVLSDTYTSNDTYMVFQEVNGVPNQGASYNFDVYSQGLSDIYANIELYYAQDHGLIIGCYSYLISDWIALYQIAALVNVETVYRLDIPAVCHPPSSSDRLQVRLYHTTPGNAAHQLLVDYIYLDDGTSSPTSDTSIYPYEYYTTTLSTGGVIYFEPRVTLGEFLAGVGPLVLGLSIFAYGLMNLLIKTIVRS